MPDADGQPSGLPVALLHGLGADTRAFQRFVRLLPDEWDPRAFDLLGHGRARKPERGYSLEQHTDYVAGVIEQEFPGESVAVVGHSYGAGVGLALAALRPQLVRCLVMLEPGSRSGEDSARMMQAKREGTLEQMVHTLFGTQSEALQRWVIDTWQTMAMGVIDELDPDWRRFGRRVTCPVTVVHGDASAGASGEGAAEQVRGATAVRIAGAGHFIHATHARETAGAVEAAVERMLGEVSAAQGAP